ncbi:thioredoxin family protein [Methylobacterium sp. J-088]|nr:thioredoxin family protein [Methylobacterium sp. J-088]MCJ2064736.1 thioredoxin family protein [Methylobacterium sp. J-088]
MRPLPGDEPIIEEVAAEYAGEIAVRAADIEADPAIAERLAVRGIPLLVLFRGGAEVGRVSGVMSKTRVCAFIDGHLDPAQ